MTNITLNIEEAKEDPALKSTIAHDGKKIDNLFKTLDTDEKITKKT